VVTASFAPSADTGNVELIDSDFHVLNPQQYRYTTRDGTVFLIDKAGGVQKVQCTNGPALTVGPNGISHDAGQGVLFARDAAGRITSSRSPSRTASCIQFETRPPGTRFTVTFQSASTPGALARE